MSGGSYDYLYLADDAYELARKREALTRMSERLGGLPWASAAAVETERIAAAFRRLDSYIAASRPLMDVWHAIEWWDSYDSSEDQAREVAAKYEALNELEGVRP